MKKKEVFLLIFMLFLLLQVSATGNKDTMDSEDSINIIKVATVASRIPWVQAAADEYENANPGVDIQLIEIMSSSDMYTKLTMMMQSPQTCPDLIVEDGFMIHSDSAAGYLESLDDMCSDWEDIKYFDKAVLKGGQGADGKQYGIPLSTDVQCIWYNNILMKKAGVSVPFEPRNWDDILDAAKKMKELGIQDLIPIFMFASKNSPEETSMRTFQTLYSGTGSELYDFDTKKWIVDKENLRNVFNFINDVYNVEKVGPPLSIAFQSNVGDLFQSDYMKNEKLGMYFSGSWEAGNWGKGKKYEWADGLDVYGVVAIPTIDGREPRYTTMSGGWTWAVPTNAKNKAGGEDFLKCISNKENSLDYALLTGDLAVRSDVIADSRYTGQEMSIVKEAAVMMQYTHFRPSLEGYATLTAMFTEVTESIAMGTATPEEAVATFESEMKRIIGKENVTVK